MSNFGRHPLIAVANTTKKWTKRTFNSGFFDKGIISPNGAWFLGLAYGDGSIQYTKESKCPNRFEMKLQFKDIHVLHNLIHMLDSDHDVRIETWKIAQGKSVPRPLGRLVISNKQFATAMHSLGCVERKCNKIAFPHTLTPPEFVKDFIRGYFDADGSLVLGRNGIVLCLLVVVRINSFTNYNQHYVH